MRIAYITSDEVNRDVALRLAKACGATLYSPALGDAPPDGQFNAILYDWDYLPPQRKHDLLEVLLAGPSPCPVALHSYSLDEVHGKALRRNGVAIYRRLDLELFLHLCLAVDRVHAAARAGLRRRGLSVK
jgi:hypothetical protein